MKTYATYGLGAALAGAALTLGMFFAGLHGENIAQMNVWWIKYGSMLLNFVIPVVAVALGLRAVREDAPGRGLSYGRGLGVGTLIGIWYGFGTAVFVLVYGLVINPGFKDALIADQVAQLQAKGLPPEAIAMAEKVMNFTMNPWIQAGISLPWAVFFAFIIALVAAAVLKRLPDAEPLAEPPVVPPANPFHAA